MRKAVGILTLIVIIFIGAWSYLASSLGPFWLEGEHLEWGYGIAKTGSIHYSWNFDINKVWPHDLKYSRSLILPYLCSLAINMPGNPLVWCRLVPLFFLLLTFCIVTFYFYRRGDLSPQRLIIWSVLFFCSSIIIDMSYYLRPYTMLGAAMSITFILYWEAVAQFRQNDKKKALLFGLLSLLPLGLSVLDQWQLEGIPAFCIAVATSILAFNPRFSLLYDWVKRKSGLLLAVTMLMAPIVVQGKLLERITSLIYIGGFNLTTQFFSNYLDNCMGWLRFILAINVGLLTWRYAFTSKTPMTFYRWIFINGILTGIFNILYLPFAPVYFPMYAYLPILMVVIGLSGMMEDVFINRSLLKRMVVIYVLINLPIAAINVLELNNAKKAIHWLSGHLAQDDILLIFAENTNLYFCGEGKLLPRTHNIDASTDKKHIMDLIKFISSHPHGRIFYFYKNDAASRAWLYRAVIGKDMDPPLDLQSYLRIQIPATTMIPGLRNCGLLEFDRPVLLNSLEDLLRQGYGPKPHYGSRDFIHHLMKT